MPHMLKHNLTKLIGDTGLIKSILNHQKLGQKPLVFSNFLEFVLNLKMKTEWFLITLQWAKNGEKTVIKMCVQREVACFFKKNLHSAAQFGPLCSKIPVDKGPNHLLH